MSEGMLNEFKKIWLVGASSGIGLSLAKALDESDKTLFLSARSGDSLEALSSDMQAQGVPLPLDITNEGEVEAAASAIQEQANYLDMLIVNAGTCEYQDDLDLDLDMLERVTRTNYLGAVSVIAKALPLLRKSKRLGRAVKLVVMSSSVTYQALPRAHAYGASKAALRYYTECLKIDLQKEGIDVHIVSPGFVKTPLTDLNDFDMPFLMSPDDAAEAIVKGLHKGSPDISFPKRFTRSLKLLSVLPNALKFKLLGNMARNTPARQP